MTDIREQKTVGKQYRSLTQIIVETLRDRILEGEYKPGSRMNIAELAQQFEVSPVPVREALRNLETEGLVTFRLNRGVVVRELSASEVRELYLLRTPLEILAAKEAIRLVKPEDVVRLREILSEMTNTAGQDQWHVLHGEFHRTFSGLSKMPRLVQIVDVLRGQMWPYRKLYLYQANPEEVQQIDAEHNQMVDYLERGDIDQLGALVARHLSRPARMALNALGSDLPLDLE